MAQRNAVPVTVAAPKNRDLEEKVKYGRPLKDIERKQMQWAEEARAQREEKDRKVKAEAARYKLGQIREAGRRADAQLLSDLNPTMPALMSMGPGLAFSHAAKLRAMAPRAFELLAKAGVPAESPAWSQVPRVVGRAETFANVVGAASAAPVALPIARELKKLDTGNAGDVDPGVLVPLLGYIAGNRGIRRLETAFKSGAWRPPEGYPVPRLDLANEMLAATGKKWSQLSRAEKMHIRQETGLQMIEGGGGAWHYLPARSPGLSEDFANHIRAFAESEGAKHKLVERAESITDNSVFRTSPKYKAMSNKLGATVGFVYSGDVAKKGAIEHELSRAITMHDYYKNEYRKALEAEKGMASPLFSMSKEDLEKTRLWMADYAAQKVLLKRLLPVAKEYEALAANPAVPEPAPWSGAIRDAFDYSQSPEYEIAYPGYLNTRFETVHTDEDGLLGSNQRGSGGKPARVKVTQHSLSRGIDEVIGTGNHELQGHETEQRSDLPPGGSSSTGRVAEMFNKPTEDSQVRGYALHDKMIDYLSHTDAWRGVDKDSIWSSVLNYDDTVSPAQERAAEDFMRSAFETSVLRDLGEAVKRKDSIMNSEHISSWDLRDIAATAGLLDATRDPWSYEDGELLSIVNAHPSAVDQSILTSFAKNLYDKSNYTFWPEQVEAARKSGFVDSMLAIPDIESARRAYGEASAQADTRFEEIKNAYRSSLDDLRVDPGIQMYVEGNLAKLRAIKDSAEEGTFKDLVVGGNQYHQLGGEVRARLMQKVGTLSPEERFNSLVDDYLSDPSVNVKPGESIDVRDVHEVKKGIDNGIDVFRQDAKGGDTRAAETPDKKESTAPTDEQIADALEFLKMFKERERPSNEWEALAIDRIIGLVQAVSSSPSAEPAAIPE